jgi:serine/threonine-protein kinase
MDTKEKRERFGRYLILDHLGDGGMAKICRARFLGEQADKVVAIKMVQSKFSADEQFKTMFMDEIKVTFGTIG